MKLKLNAEGKPEFVNDLPVYIHDDKTEAPFDAKATVATIARLNGEAKDNRVRAETAEAALKPFEGIADPKAALNALRVVENLDQKKLVDAGQVEQIRTEAVKAVEEKYAPIVKKNGELETRLHRAMIGGAFSRSPLIVGKDAKIAIPADLVEARFGHHFKLDDDGGVVATDSHGNKIFSRTRPGEPADFDEALGILVEQYPHKDSILKGSNASGSGAGNSGQGQQGTGGKRQVSRASFNSMTPADQAATGLDKNVVITD